MATQTKSRRPVGSEATKNNTRNNFNSNKTTSQKKSKSGGPASWSRTRMRSLGRLDDSQTSRGMSYEYGVVSNNSIMGVDSAGGVEKNGSMHAHHAHEAQNGLKNPRRQNQTQQESSMLSNSEGSSSRRNNKNDDIHNPSYKIQEEIKPGEREQILRTYFGKDTKVPPRRKSLSKPSDLPNIIFNNRELLAAAGNSSVHSLRTTDYTHNTNVSQHSISRVFRDYTQENLSPREQQQNQQTVPRTIGHTDPTPHPQALNEKDDSMAPSSNTSIAKNTNNSTDFPSIASSTQSKAQRKQKLDRFGFILNLEENYSDSEGSDSEESDPDDDEEEGGRAVISNERNKKQKKRPKKKSTQNSVATVTTTTTSQLKRAYHSSNSLNKKNGKSGGSLVQRISRLRALRVVATSNSQMDRSRQGSSSGAAGSSTQSGENYWKQEMRVRKWTKMVTHWDRLYANEVNNNTSNDISGKAMGSSKRQAKLKKRLRKGIPDSLRGATWALLGNNVPNKIDFEHKGEYQRLLKIAAKLDVDPSQSKSARSNSMDELKGIELPSEECKDTIERDIHRTFPKHYLFYDAEQFDPPPAKAAGEKDQDIDDTPPDLLKSMGGQASLRRVLRAYSIYDPQVGYCQGMNFISAMFITFMTEEESFWLLVYVMSSPPCLMRRLFDMGMYQARAVLHIADRLVAQFLPKLHAHFEKEMVHVSMYATQWLLTMYTAPFPFDLVTRVWDCFLCEGWKIAYRVLIGILTMYQPELLKMKFEDIMAYIKAIPNKVNGDQVLDAAFAVPLKTKHIEKFQKEFNANNS